MFKQEPIGAHVHVLFNVIIVMIFYIYPVNVWLPLNTFSFIYSNDTIDILTLNVRTFNEILMYKKS